MINTILKIVQREYVVGDNEFTDPDTYKAVTRLVYIFVG